MKTTERFDRAVTKLYNAFHNNELDACDCTMCAVGNICDRSSMWARARDLGSKKPCADADPESLRVIEMSGYSLMELINIECVFMHGYLPDEDFSDRRFHRNATQAMDRETNFKGLCAVVEYLCELDNIPNVMDYTKLFEYDKELNPIHQL